MRSPGVQQIGIHFESTQLHALEQRYARHGRELVGCRSLWGPVPCAIPDFAVFLLRSRSAVPCSARILPVWRIRSGSQYKSRTGNKMVRKTYPHRRTRGIWFPTLNYCESNCVRHLTVSDLAMWIDHEFRPRSRRKLNGNDAASIVPTRTFDPMKVVAVNVGVPSIAFRKCH